MSTTQILRTSTGYQLANLHVENLPPRQAQALLLCANGMGEKAVALAMNCSPRNIKAIKNTLFLKLNANSTPELITKAFASKQLRFLTLLAALNIALVPHSDIGTRMAKIRAYRTTRELRAC